MAFSDPLISKTVIVLVLKHQARVLDSYLRLTGDTTLLNNISSHVLISRLFCNLHPCYIYFHAFLFQFHYGILVDKIQRITNTILQSLITNVHLSIRHLSLHLVMIAIHLEPGRFSRSSSQSFHVIKTHLKHIVIVFGSTGNAYLISITPSGIICNCPDKVRTCKHIIFLASACGFIKRNVSNVTVSYRTFINHLHSNPPSPVLQNSLLDNHTRILCSVHTYPPCFFCAQKPSLPPPGMLIMCSRCGFLCHGHCLRDFMEDNKNNSTFKNICPRCGRSSVQLTSSFASGYRNFGVILRHRGYACDNFPQSFTTHNYDHVTTIYNGASADGNHLCSIANDDEPNFSTNTFGSPTRFPPRNV